jgi:hypothetical protein
MDPRDSSREKWLSIGVVKKTAPSVMEKRWDKDMPAYKNLRKNGLQPRGIDGCAELEAKAVDRIEVEMGHIFDTKKELSEARAGMRLAEDMQLGLSSFGEAYPRDGV